METLKEKNIKKTSNIISTVLLYIVLYPIVFILFSLVVIKFSSYIPYANNSNQIIVDLYMILTFVIAFLITTVIILIIKKYFKIFKYLFRFFIKIIVILFCVILVAIIGLIIIDKTGILPSVYNVKGKSMLPTLREEETITCDRLKNNKLSYKDIVVFKHKKQVKGIIEDTDFIKRIVALPGDKVNINDLIVYVNDKKIDEEYVYNPHSTNLWENGFIKENIPVKVKDNNYFILGDNRELSSDTREFGFLKKEDIICVIPWKKQTIYRKNWIERQKQWELVDNFEGVKTIYKRYKYHDIFYWCSEDLIDLFNNIQEQIVLRKTKETGVVKALQEQIELKKIKEEIKTLEDKINYAVNKFCWKY